MIGRGWIGGYLQSSAPLSSSQQMTLEEKVDMLSEKSGKGLSPSRLGIPALTFADGPAGVRIDRSRRNVNEGKATSPPAPIALAATWDSW